MVAGWWSVDCLLVAVRSAGLVVGRGVASHDGRWWPDGDCGGRVVAVACCVLGTKLSGFWGSRLVLRVDRMTVWLWRLIGGRLVITLITG